MPTAELPYAMNAAIDLESVGLTVAPGEYVCVLGGPGTGKTTILSILALVRRPHFGEYRLFGRPTVALGARERSALRACVGLVPFAPDTVPHLTALENVGLGLFNDPSAAAQRDIRARSVLKLMGMEDRWDAPAVTLSGGERRRVAIACSLAPRPSILLCDEPTLGLSDDEGEAVLDALDAVRTKDLTVVTATRDAAVAARADRVMKL